MSTRVRIGRLNASQNATNRAAFCDAGMSSVPARANGWLATMPIGSPPTEANAVTTLGAQRPRNSNSSPSSTDRPDHVADVVATRRRLRHQRAGLWRLTIGRIIGLQPARFLVVVLGQVGEQLGDHVDGRLEIGSDEARRAGVAGVRCRSAELFVVDPHAGELGHHRRTGDERVRIHGHHDEVGDPRATAQARTPPALRPP